MGTETLSPEPLGDGNGSKSDPPVARGTPRCNSAGWEIFQLNGGFNGGFSIAMFDHQRATLTFFEVVSIS